MYSIRKLNRIRLGRAELVLLISLIILMMMGLAWGDRIIYSYFANTSRLGINTTFNKLQSAKVIDSKSTPISNSSFSSSGSRSGLSDNNSISLNILKFQNYSKRVFKVRNKYIKIFIRGGIDATSLAILNNEQFGKIEMNEFLLFLENFRNPILVDIGFGLGMYALAAASFYIRVVAIDHNMNNTNTLMQSVIENRLENKVTIILNAVSNIRNKFSLGTVQVSSILLDDLFPILRENEDIIIKVDTEGSEVDIFNEDSEFFSKRKIRAVLMKWLVVRQSKNCHNVMSFFNKRNYKPFEKLFSTKQLDVAFYYEWLHNIVWRKASDSAI